MAQPNENQLLIGPLAKTTEAVEIPIKMPVDLNFKTKAEVLELRRQAVASTPNLVAEPYQPSQSVFSKIEDHRPWWGVQGEAVWGPGLKSSAGPAEESRFILNPYILAGANPAVMEVWDAKKITEEDLNDPEFPWIWEPEVLRWWPSQSLCQVSYNVTNFMERLQSRGSKLKRPKIVPAFGVAAYNAADFNLNFIYLDPSKSIHIENINKVDAKAVQIEQYIHCGDTCKIPGGCNNMSPAIKALDKIKFKSLPARACVLLWHHKPDNVKTNPDMTVYIDLK